MITTENTLCIGSARWLEYIDERIVNFTKSLDRFNWPYLLFIEKASMTSYLDAKFSWALDNSVKKYNDCIEYVVFLDCADSVVTQPWDRFIWQASHLDIPNKQLFTGAHRNDIPNLSCVAEKNEEQEFTVSGYAMLGKLEAFTNTVKLMKDLSADYAETRTRYSDIWQNKPLMEYTDHAMSRECDDVYLSLVRAIDKELVVPDIMRLLFSRYDLSEYKNLTDLRYALYDKSETFNSYIGGCACVHMNASTFQGPLYSWYSKNFS